MLQAEADVIIFLKLLQIAHSLFQEVDELKSAIDEIAKGVDSTGNTELPN